MRWRIFLPLLFALLLGSARSAEVIPAAPRDHFNDYAGVVHTAAAQHLESELTQFERTSSNQLLVVIYPHMQSDSSIEDYTVRVAQAWKVGLKDQKNGAVLFVFSQDRKLYVQVGYGLEGVLPDALCKQIIENEITPHFRQGDFDAGLEAGVTALIAATRNEYHGTGHSVADRQRGNSNSGSLPLMFFVIVLIVMILLRQISARSTLYNGRGRISPWLAAGFLGGSFGGGGGGGFSGGGGSFSGGGGSFGGGGAGGSW
jgi:uncharacterized protein